MWGVAKAEGGTLVVEPPGEWTAGPLRPTPNPDTADKCHGEYETDGRLGAESAKSRSSCMPDNRGEKID